MSVALLINKGEGKEDELLPIATEGTFIGLWNPVIHNLNLEWMSFFQVGTTMEREDLEEVLAEVGKFWEEAERLSRFRKAYVPVEQRASLLKARLEAMQEEAFEDFFIG